LPIAVSAICAALIAQMAWKDPRYLLPFGLVVVMAVLPALLARRRMSALGNAAARLDAGRCPDTGRL
jgi:hypothetical protein